MRKAVCGFVLLAALFIATAAPRGFGGGFGGGRSFGGGSVGGGRTYGGPSYGGGGYRGGYGGYYGGPRGFYYGPGVFFFGGSGAGLLLLVIVGGIALVVGGAAVAGWLGSRYTLYSVGLNLRRGARYASKLDALIESSDFATPAGRARALHMLAKMVDESDVVDGYAVVGRSFAQRDQVGQQAEDLARAQMQRIGITPGAVNVTTGDGQGVRLEAPSDEGGGGKAHASDACVLAVLVTLRRRAAKALRQGGQTEALAALQQLTTVPGGEFDALYFYYAPNAAEPLDPVSADRLFLDLRATAKA